MAKTETAPVRVLIVDDSALMRKLLSDLLGSSPRLAVVGVARDGEEALKLAERLRPDVVTLDVEMPGMSGLDVLPRLLTIYEVPVVMVSAYTQQGAEVTLTALERGAVDFMPKPDKHQITEMRACRDLLVSKILTASLSKVRRIRKPPSDPSTAVKPPSSHSLENRPPTDYALPVKPPSDYALPVRPPSDYAIPVKPPSSYAIDTTGSGERATVPTKRCIVLGISTGGPQTLTQVFTTLEPPIPPVLVVQHMPAQFTSVLAQRLARQCRVAVKEAAEGDRVLPNQILIAPGGRHLTLTGRPPQARVALCDEPPVSGHRPSVDVLFTSAARIYQAAAVAVIMTGMGRDGVDGCKQVLAAGGLTYGQDEFSSIVYGMSKAAYEEGAVKIQFSSEDLATIIMALGQD